MLPYDDISGWYDWVAAEPVYRVGRLLAVSALELEPGERVLDVGCGTGLNLPLLLDAVGATGQVVGVDVSAPMLDRARHRARRLGASGTRFIQADASELTPADLEGLASEFDAVLFTYSLSIMPRWHRAWTAATALLREGGRCAVVDMQPPRGLARVASPLTHLVCRLAGSDPQARPWTALEEELVDVRRWSRRGGHVQVRVGTKPRMKE